MNKTAGGVIAIVVAVTLCLAIFGALAISSAYADISLSDRMGDTVLAYYEADARTQGILKEISEAIDEAYAASSGSGDYARKITDKLADKLDCETSGDSVIITIETAVNDRQFIKAVVATSYSLGGGYTVDSYQLSGSGEIVDDPLDLWTGF